MLGYESGVVPGGVSATRNQEAIPNQSLIFSTSLCFLSCWTGILGVLPLHYLCRGLASFLSCTFIWRIHWQYCRKDISVAMQSIKELTHHGMKTASADSFFCCCYVIGL